MAESTESTESLVKKEPEVPAQDPIVSRSTSGIMLVCALLLTASLAWSLYDEAFGQRPWKNMQKEFVGRYSKYLKSIKSQSGKTEAEVKESPEYQGLDGEAQAALEKVKPEIGETDQKVVQIQRELDAVTEPFQNQRGKLTVINYNVEIASTSAKDKFRKQAQEKRSERMSKRDNISISEALDILKMRDRENKNIYKNIYGSQFGENKDVFDFIINTELLTLESLVYLCKEIIKKMKVQ